MNCLFLLQRGEDYYCEVLEDKYGDNQELTSPYLCERACESCSLYCMVKEAEPDEPTRTNVGEQRIFSSTLFGHINRIGGFRALLPDLEANIG